MIGRRLILTPVRDPTFRKLFQSFLDEMDADEVREDAVSIDASGRLSSRCLRALVGLRGTSGGS